MRKIKMLLVGIAMLACGLAYGQNITVTGVVTDSSTGEPLSGAAILVKGTPQGVVADNDGRYSIVVSPNATLGFTTIGFKDVEVAVNGRTVINVALDVDTETLDDVVIVAYGSQSAKKVTASVSTVKTESLKDLPNVGFDAMLQGQAAGVQVATANAGSGQSASIRIRGISSISGGTDPLYIVDGLPISSSSTLIAGYTDASALSDINPVDILSIDILKDAAATALYGSRAANGVILITTKKGSQGTTKVTYDASVGFQEATKTFKMMNANQYVDFKNMAVKNAYGTDEVDLGGGVNKWGSKSFNLMKDANGNPIDTDWSSLIYKKGLIHNHTVAIQGGSEKYQFYASANYASQDGIIVGDSYKRAGVKANVSSQINKWLQVGISMQYTHSNTEAADASRQGSVFASAGLPRMAMIMPTILTPYNDDGSYNTMSGGQYIGTGGIRLKSLSYPNPMTVLENFNKVGQDRIIANGFVSLTPIKGLELKSQYGVDYMKNHEETFWSPNYGQGAQYPGYAYISYADNTDWTWTNTATYDFHFGENTFNVLAGMEAYHSEYAYDGGTGSKILNSAYTGFKAGYEEYAFGGATGAMALISYFARINYDYKAKYMLSANYRRDGLSSLGANKKWGNFWGVSAAWRVSEEGFFQPLLNVVNDFKIKSSYGVVGNSDIGYYSAQSYYSDAVYGKWSSLGIDNIGDANLAWEQSVKFDVGFSAQLFNRIDLEFDYYNTKSTNLVMAVPQGPSTGIGSLVTNTGSLENKGFELSIGADVIRNKNFTWNTNFNFTTVKNKVLSLAEGIDAIYADGDDESGSNVTLPGYSIGQLYLYPTGGIDPQTGCRIFYGSNGEWTIYDRARGDWYLADGTAFKGDLVQVRAGNTVPTWYGGWSNTFRFFGFDASLMFQFSGGNWIYNGNSASGSDMRWWNNFAEVADRCWKQPGDNAKYAKPIYGDNVSNGSAYDITDWLEKGDYIRLKNISLGYTFKPKHKDRSGFSSIRIYGLVQNAFVLTAYTGLDPEVTSSYTQAQNANGGYDKNTLPHARTYTFGAQFSF